MKLIPMPQSVQTGEGFFRIKYSHRITMTAACAPEVYDSALLLAEEMKKAAGFGVMIDRRSAKYHPGVLLDVAENAENPEGYTLEINDSGVVVTGASVRGLHYGIQTLRQLVRQFGCLLPWVKIADHPDLKARGLFYDTTRGRIPTMEYLKKLAELCSFYKLNQLHLYIEHCFLFDGLSEMWRDDTPLTAGDILELDAYCRKRHVELVPSVASLGHMYKILRTKTYRHLPELPEEEDAEFSFHNRMAHHTLDVTQDESLELVFRLFDEYASLFTSKLFNINGDEPFDLGRGRGKELADQIGSHQMYVDWIGKVCAHVKEMGLRPMFWGDVILAEPETIKQLPADIICMNWDYDTVMGRDHAAKLQAAGANQYLCPGAQGWNQLVNLFENAYINIRKMADLAHKHSAEGLLVTEWGDYGHIQDPESSIPGIIYSAAMGWNKNIPGEEELNEAISVVEYGDPTGKLMSVLRSLSQQSLMEWRGWWTVVIFTEIKRGRMKERSFEHYWADVEPMLKAHAPELAEKNGNIDHLQAQIACLMPTMGARQRMYPFFVMSDGQKLLNRFAVVLAGGEDRTLASDLECWYQEYKTLWHTTSRESELYRIGEVIFWMADYLRK